MSSLEDLHCTKAETSVTAPIISMETILTGMATVRPVRMAVLMISVSYGEKGEIFMRQREAESYYPLCFITDKNNVHVLKAPPRGFLPGDLGDRPELILPRRVSLDFINWHFHLKYQELTGMGTEGTEFLKESNDLHLYRFGKQMQLNGVLRGSSQHRAPICGHHKRHDIYLADGQDPE